MEIRNGIRLLIPIVVLLVAGAVSGTALSADSVSSLPANGPGTAEQRLFGTSAGLGIVEINPATGVIIHSFATPLRQGVADGLTFDGVYLYYLSGSWDPNTLYVLNPSTGGVEKTYTLPPNSFRNGLAYLNGLIYILEWGALSQNIAVFNPQSGTVVGVLDIDGANPGAPLISGGLAGITGPDALMVTTASTKELLEINPTTGKITNRFVHNQLGTAGAAVVAGRIYLAPNAGSAIQIFLRNGTSQGSITIPGAIGFQSLGGDDTLGTTSTPTATASATATRTPTPTVTSAPTATPTVTPTATVTPSPSPAATATPTTTATPGDTNGAIGGIVWFDRNGNGRREATEPGVAGVILTLVAGGTQMTTTITTGSGAYAFQNLLPGEYEVRETNPVELRHSTTPDAVPVTVSAGDTAIADFGDWDGPHTYLPLLLRQAAQRPPTWRVR